jgi:hypothetical protein
MTADAAAPVALAQEAGAVPRQWFRLESELMYTVLCEAIHGRCGGAADRTVLTTERRVGNP